MMDRESAEEIGRARFLLDGIGQFFYANIDSIFFAMALWNTVLIFKAYCVRMNEK
jgi:hypothetical protein